MPVNSGHYIVFWSFFQNEIRKTLQFIFVAFNKSIIPFALGGYGMIVRLISYQARARGIIVKY